MFVTELMVAEWNRRKQVNAERDAKVWANVKRHMHAAVPQDY